MVLSLTLPSSCRQLIWGTAPALLMLLSCTASTAPSESAASCETNDDCGEGVCVEGACGQAESNAGTMDTGMGTTDTAPSTMDTTPSTMDTVPDMPLGSVGDPCTDEDDCRSGFCIEAAGEGRRVCTDFCDTTDASSCPNGYTCAAVNNSGADVTFLCFPEVDILCRPCEDDSDCGGLNDLCMETTDGRYCARDCQLQACPEGYTCSEVEGPNGSTATQCLPDGGICSDCFDPDNDEHGIGPGCLGEDCDEENPDINTGALELCNGVDDNCDGNRDEGYDLDNDPLNCGTCGEVCTFEGAEALCMEGTCQPGPCLDNRYDIDGRLDNGCEYFCEASADGVELCNGRDDNCDGTVDEGNPEAGGDCETDEPGICQAGTVACEDGTLVCVPQREPLAEMCNGVDDDCNGNIDEGNPGGGGACNTGEVGQCSAGTLQCTDGQLLCEPLNLAQDELCNGLDDDCDGPVDEGNPEGGGACDTDGLGLCGVGTLVCTEGG
ncbi:MAG: putative metal-binding motif-containing protein, partial [Myxococcota bacterium]